jgi:hypothetical protein
MASPMPIHNFAKLPEPLPATVEHPPLTSNFRADKQTTDNFLGQSRLAILRKIKRGVCYRTNRHKTPHLILPQRIQAHPPPDNDILLKTYLRQILSIQKNGLPLGQYLTK